VKVSAAAVQAWFTAAIVSFDAIVAAFTATKASCIQSFRLGLALGLRLELTASV